MNILDFSIIDKQIKEIITNTCGLNISQTRILLFFDESHNQSLNMGKLAKELEISLSTLSRQLKQKNTQKFIKIKYSQFDSSKNIQLNALGLKKVEKLKVVLKKIEQNIFSILNKNEQTKFINQLDYIAHNISK